MHCGKLLLGRFLLGAEEGPGAAANRSGVVSSYMMLDTVSRGKFGVAGGVDRANVWKLFEEVGQLVLDADVVDVGVVGLVLVDGLDEEAGASLCQIPAPVIFNQIISLQEVSSQDGRLDGGVDEGMVEELTAEFHLLFSGPKSWNLVTSRAGQLDLDWVVSGAGFVLRPERSHHAAVYQKTAAAFLCK